MGQKLTVRLIMGAALIAILGSVNVARAAFVAVASGANLPDTDATTTDNNNAKYKVTYANGNVTYDSGDVGSQQGTVKITDAFTDCSAHTYTFTQTALPTDDPNPANAPIPFQSTGGLRIQLQLMITNNSGHPWEGFWVKTDDKSVPTNVDPGSAGGTGSHNHQAHFHPNGATPPPGPPTVTGTGPMGTGFTTPATGDLQNTTMFMIGGGQQPDAGSGFTMMGFFLHERNLKKAAEPPNPAMAVTRTFDLILMPHCVPELSSYLSWSLTLLSGLGLVWGWHRFGGQTEKAS